MPSTPLQHDVEKNDEDEIAFAEVDIDQQASGHNGIEALPTHRYSDSLKDVFADVHGITSGVHTSRHAHTQQDPVRLRHLFKRPVVRQWVKKDKLYREIAEREATHVELFFDLIMAGVVHTLAEGAAEEASGLNAAKFVLLFFPAWSMWSDVRSFMNISGTDDVWQRIYLLFIMALLLGYSANATGIIIKEGDKLDAPTSLASGVPDHAVQDIAERALTGLFKRNSLSKDFAPGEIGSAQEIAHTGFWFAVGYKEAIDGAMGFYLVAKCTRLALYFIYGWLLPCFRKALWLNGLSLVVITCVYLPIFRLKDPAGLVILVCCGILLELIIRYVFAAILQHQHRRAKHRGHETFMPAYSLTHLMERMTQFTILIMGESILSATYVAYKGEYGVAPVYGRAVMALMCAFSVIWIYFDNDSSRTFVHAVKRHWFTSITFTHMHFPLSASLILLSSTLKALIRLDFPPRSYIWINSGSMAVAMISLGIIGSLHKSLDKWGSALIPKSTRIFVRFTLGAVFALLPLIREWRSEAFLAVQTTCLALCVVFETVGKLHAVGRVYDPVRTEALRRQRAAAKGTLGKSRWLRLRKEIPGPDCFDEWHEYEDLTSAERGDEDVGIEANLGQLEAKHISSGERWAYVET